VIRTEAVDLHSQGSGQVINITQAIAQAVQNSGLGSGIVTVFCPSATSGVTTIEYEEGAVHDFQRLFDQLAPPDQMYEHHLRWGGGNGHSHVRAALLGPSLTIPFVNRRLTLGTWQQIVFVDFDARPRQRSLVVQMMGE